MPDASLIIVDSPAHAPGVSVITLNSSEKRNVLSKAMITEFLGDLSRVSADSNTKVIVVTGRGSCFSGELNSEPRFLGSLLICCLTAGADIKEISTMDTEAARSCRYLEDLCHGMAAVRKPVLAAVDGPALGGGFELAMMFVLPEVNLGLIPGAGGTQRLTSALSKFRAMKAILLGTPISSEEALSCGLVCDMFKDGQVLGKTIDYRSCCTAGSSRWCCRSIG
ncbi:enoyl- hydratase [Fusarium agapanthi]|uniref:Enoyl- hydratase n=1 Tax=Fusarium agapanthi TaxID=1803897 RepID=A0A9P5BH36_9HYPO|nr:enoyl- hydratase [Fusarium agapanthi]